MIYAIGDSFTYGEELPDRNLAWPSQLGLAMGKQVTNLGKPASGNYRMVKRTMDAVLNGDAETVIIGWSDPARQEFGDDIGITDIWAGRDYSRMQSVNDHRINLIKYMTAYDVPEYYYRKWLREIIMVQTFCKANNVNCLMFIACGAREFNSLYASKHEDLIKHIDKTTFVDWPNNGIQEWVYGTPHGANGHPLEEGHAIISNKIYEHIRHLGWLS